MNHLFRLACAVTLLIVACGDNDRPAGPVNLCAEVTCVASDACHRVGVCDKATGICSNPAKPNGTACDDGNACSSGDTCSAGACSGVAYTCPPPAVTEECHLSTSACGGDGTCSVPTAPDGTSCCGPIPTDHCDAVFHGSCNAGVCGNYNACGDGAIELALGESCDDGNAAAGDGCDAACHVEPFVTTGPVKISGTLSCTTAVANAARKIAVDGSGNIVAVMQCGSTAYVAVSTDRGQSFSAPLDLSTALGTPSEPAVVSQVAVAPGPSGTAYVGFILSTGAVMLRATQDRGATWSAGISIGTSGRPGSGLSLQAFNDDIYVGFAQSASSVAVARNHHRGTGTFDITPVAMSVSFFDLIYDVALGTLAVCTDTPAFHIRVSSDAGASFAAEVNPPGAEFFSDWTLGNGQIFVSGTHLNATTGNSSMVFQIPASNPSTSTAISGLPVVTSPQTRTLAADAAGNAFVASQLNGGGVQLDRLAAGASAFDAPRAIDPMGGSPVVGALPGNLGAAIVYTRGTEVWATIQAY